MIIRITVIDVRGDIGELCTSRIHRIAVEDDEIDGHRVIVFCEKRTDGLCGNADGIGTRIAVNAGGDQRKGNRFAPRFFCQTQGRAVTGGKQDRFSALTVVIDRSHGVDDVLCRQIVAGCDLGISRFAAAERHAFGEQSRSCRTVNGTVDTASSQKGRIRGVDDGVNLHFGDILSDEQKRHERAPFYDQSIGYGSAAG